MLTLDFGGPNYIKQSEFGNKALTFQSRLYLPCLIINTMLIMLSHLWVEELCVRIKILLMLNHITIIKKARGESRKGGLCVSESKAHKFHSQPANHCGPWHHNHDDDDQSHHQCHLCYRHGLQIMITTLQILPGIRAIFRSDSPPLGECRI